LIEGTRVIYDGALHKKKKKKKIPEQIGGKTKDK
jgi:hypothetical protein